MTCDATLKKRIRFADNWRMRPIQLRSKGAMKMSDAVLDNSNDTDGAEHSGDSEQHSTNGEHSNETGMRTALGTLLIEAGFLDSERLEEALRIGADSGERLGEVVVRKGWASEDDLAKILADQWSLRYVDRSAISFDENALSRMSREEATRLEALPMQVSKDGAVVVAVAEPTDARLVALRTLLGDRIDCVVVAKSAIDAGLRSKLLAGGLDTVVEETTITPAGDSDEASVPKASDFDKVATTLSEGLSSQLASLRAIVVEAEAARERDSLEITRLSHELSERNTELTAKSADLSERNDQIKSIQQSLRELASTLDQNS